MTGFFDQKKVFGVHFAGVWSHLIAQGFGAAVQGFITTAGG